MHFKWKGGQRLYMAQPSWFELGQNLVCKLRHSLYGLKQVSHAWTLKLASVLQILGFTTSKADNSFTSKILRARQYFSSPMWMTSFFLVRIRLRWNKSSKISKTSFPWRILVRWIFFLGIEIKRTATQLHPSQQKYIIHLLRWVDTVDAKGISTPMILGKTLSRFEGQLIPNAHQYRSIVGAL